jgi:hypothetical protein
MLTRKRRLELRLMPERSRNRTLRRSRNFLNLLLLMSLGQRTRKPSRRSKINVVVVSVVGRKKKASLKNPKQRNPPRSKQASRLMRPKRLKASLRADRNESSVTNQSLKLEPQRKEKIPSLLHCPRMM